MSLSKACTKGGRSAEAPMSSIESLIFLLGAAALLAQLARILKVPYPVFLVLGGLLIGLAPGLPTVAISPEIVFLVFLPPLLNYAAFFSSPRDLRRHLRPLLALALGRGLRPRGNPCPNRSGGGRGNLPSPGSARKGEHDSRGREPRQRRYGTRRLPPRRRRSGYGNLLGVGGGP